MSKLQDTRPALLEVRQLQVQLPSQGRMLRILRDLSFTLERGERLGLIGESGSGKSLTALALMGLLPGRAESRGEITLEGQSLLNMPARGWQALRGRRMAMIFQEPMTALNPVHRMGRQVAEPMRLHLGLSRRAAWSRAVALMQQVGIGDAPNRARAFPHQFSGGQRQRLMIAMALGGEPELLIADEPTTALDVLVQRDILKLIDRLVQARRMALLLISHDLRLIAAHSDRLLVMYGGQIVEVGPSRRVLEHPAHPYTRGLLAARPTLSRRLDAHRSKRLPTLPGFPPQAAALPAGCPFSSRCPWAMETCWQQMPPWVELGHGHAFRCWRPQAVMQQSGRDAS